MFEFSNEYLEALLKGIYSGDITEYSLPDFLYKSIAKYLKAGLYEGYGGTLKDFSGKDLQLLQELRENIYMFSAAKTYQQVKEIQGLLFDEKGDLRTQKQFNALGENTFDLWNKTWGETEYNTAVGQAQNAVKWNDIEENKDVLPMLRYSAVVDPNTSEICLPLDGMVAPVDDPIWNTVSPLNHFGCRCLLLQEGPAVKVTPGNGDRVKDIEGKMQDVFKMNPGKDGYVFKEDHPYFAVPKQDKAYAARNFDLPIPKHD
jgi:SPP1 gp7 family putative phage head morphogenesis protein